MVCQQSARDSSTTMQRFSDAEIAAFVHEEQEVLDEQAQAQHDAGAEQLDGQVEELTTSAEREEWRAWSDDTFRQEALERFYDERRRRRQARSYGEEDECSSLGSTPVIYPSGYGPAPPRRCEETDETSSDLEARLADEDLARLDRELESDAAGQPAAEDPVAEAMAAEEAEAAEYWMMRADVDELGRALREAADGRHAEYSADYAANALETFWAGARSVAQFLARVEVLAFLRG